MSYMKIKNKPSPRGTKDTSLSKALYATHVILPISPQTVSVDDENDSRPNDVEPTPDHPTSKRQLRNPISLSCVRRDIHAKNTNLWCGTKQQQRRGYIGERAGNRSSIQEKKCPKKKKKKRKKFWLTNKLFAIGNEARWSPDGEGVWGRPGPKPSDGDRSTGPTSVRCGAGRDRSQPSQARGKTAIGPRIWLLWLMRPS
ncbi:hypothetical protein N658DRAFT_41187 [Parathielavia hyrcaniae]|uniref:Uncharacterized protein n=1 Tax=Parathielavia hyrcaniae TaxID=113614 RepID=A0AAN6T2Q3_9PEZI|nr:hypothetical protein N658DRAFT_41187 [Parathielavia hyrcaniae]